MKFSVITRCTRLGNIETVKESVFANIPKGCDVEWHVVFDTKMLKDIDAELLNRLEDDRTILHFRKGDGWGLSQLNVIIEKLEGWIYHCDDDNIIHEDFYSKIYESHLENKDALAFVVAQQVDGKDFTGLQQRRVSPADMKVQRVDLAQWIIHSDLHKDWKYGSGYRADGQFLEALYSAESDKFVIIDEILSHYNYLEKKSKANVPNILYIGEKRPVLKSNQMVNWESNELNVRYELTDENIRTIIPAFKPDAIVTESSNLEMYPNLCNLPLNFRRKWIVAGDLNEIDLGQYAYMAAMKSILDPQNLDDESMISFFTPIYNTGEKLWKTYESVAAQTYPNWEWVLVNDSSDGGKTLKIAEEIAANDPRVRVYDFREKSGGNIGEVKWRACSMAKGYILAELDHDDLLVETIAEHLHNAAQAHPECGMFFGDTSEFKEDGTCNMYPPGFAMGYGTYRTEEYKGKEVMVCNQPGINPRTIRHIVGVPNHIRAFRRSTYFEVGGHNRNLTVVDDYELIIRMFLKSRLCKIPAFSYIQFLYSNASGQNTHDLARADIQRKVRTIADHYNEQIRDRFEELGVKDWAYEENPRFPYNVEPRFGEEENDVCIVYQLESEKIKSN